MIYRLTKKEAKRCFEAGEEVIISTGNYYNLNKSSLIASKKYYLCLNEAVEDFLNKNEDVRRPSYFV